MMYEYDWYLYDVWMSVASDAAVDSVRPSISPSHMTYAFHSSHSHLCQYIVLVCVCLIAIERVDIGSTCFISLLLSSPHSLI